MIPLEKSKPFHAERAKIKNLVEDAEYLQHRALLIDPASSYPPALSVSSAFLRARVPVLFTGIYWEFAGLLSPPREQ